MPKFMVEFEWEGDQIPELSCRKFVCEAKDEEEAVAIFRKTMNGGNIATPPMHETSAGLTIQWTKEMKPDEMWDADVLIGDVKRME